MNSEVEHRHKNISRRIFESMDKRLDDSCGLTYVKIEHKNVIHTNVTGIAHDVRDNSMYAQYVYMCGIEHRYNTAEHIIRKVIELQDKDPASKTYGLWQYYFEESLDEMSAPDYNLAEFVARPLIYIVNERAELISEELLLEIKEALGRAACCCIKRNAGLDYSNVASMSCFTIAAIGEITENEELIQKGKEELKSFWEYTKFNGTYSEYNSPCYFKVVGDSIARMMKYFKDKECRAMALELNDYLWEMVSEHYSQAFDDLAPPYVRGYHDIDVDKENKDFVYYATDGKFGSYNECLSEWEINVPKCPQKYYDNFSKELWLEKTYYKKNNLRSRDTDATIVRDFDSPDLIAYTYKTDSYMFGALQKTDLWVQRRTSMVVWDKELPKSLRLRCLKDDFDFASGMAYSYMNRNEMITAVGFSTDHGDKHYILDLFENGIIKASKLVFALQFGANKTSGVFSVNGSDYVYKDEDITITVNIKKWVFDGKEGEVRLTDNGIELVCFDGEQREVDLNALGESYGVFSMIINGKTPELELESDGERVAVKSADEEYIINMYAKPKAYDLCIHDTEVIKNII